jgi:NAD(P)-dependent dehydrogenase (short-subunit alcohol dehydrogenase family)
VNRLTGRTALVTGASAGIGRATALRLADEGARLLLVDRRTDSSLPGEDGTTADRCRAAGAEVLVAVADVAREDEVDAAFALLDDAGWGLDVLVNCAGIFTLATAADLDTAEWRRILGVNLDGYFFTIRRALPRLRDSAGPSIVNVSSVHGRLGIGGGFAYCASKGAVENLTRQVAVDYGPLGIRCNAVSPGPVETAMSLPFRQDPEQLAEYHRRVLLPRLGRPEDVAAAVAFLAGPDSAFMTGSALVVDGGWSCA